MHEQNDFWTQDEFEDSVARALIACFETRIKKSRGAGPQSLNGERMAVVRRTGPYIPGRDRVVFAPGADGHAWEFDVTNDPLPSRGCFAVPMNMAPKEDEYGGFLRMIHFQKAPALGRNWHRRAGGELYEMIYAAAEPEFIEGERSFFTVGKDGVITACELRIASAYRPGRVTETAASLPRDLAKVEACASLALQFVADSRFCWRITASEHGQLAHLGCMQEQVKSLLYARSVPLTATGRKRPILHLVEAHKRRLKAGTDIDVSAFLRGVQTIEMGGTAFTVRPPAVIIPSLSRASIDRLTA